MCDLELELLNSFRNISDYFHPAVTWEEIDIIYEKTKGAGPIESADSDQSESESIASSSNDDEPLGHMAQNIKLANLLPNNSKDLNRFVKKSKKKKINSILKIPIVQNAISNTGGALSSLLELNTTIRSLRESNSGYDNTYDSWDTIIEVSPRERYLAFIYALLSLIHQNPLEKIYRKLSIETASTYILSLTIPGSKGFHIFDEKIISHAIEIFEVIENIRSEDNFKCSKQDRIELFVRFTNFCDDLKLLFRYVHFDEYKDIRNEILIKLIKVLHNNNIHGLENSYAANLHSKCFEIFEEVINAHNGDPEDTLKKIMQLSHVLHTHPPITKKLQYFDTGNNFCEHISDWFVNIIEKYPRILTNVLKFYIEAVITNPNEKWRPEQYQKVLDYAAKYDANMYIKCNESTMSFLSLALNAEEASVRQNAIELCNRILLLESKVNWEVFRHEVSNIPREVDLIKEMLMRFHDINNTIKLKALNGFQQVCIRGTVNSKKIISECIRFLNLTESNIFLPKEPPISKQEIRFEKPDPVEPLYTFEGHDIVQPLFNNLPNSLYILFYNTNGYVRKSSIVLLESIVSLNPLIIYNSNFVKNCSSLSHDPNSLVRKQALVMIDSLLGKYSNCYPLIWTWCKIIVPLFDDCDTKNVDSALECFKRKVFDNIKGIEASNQAENFMPWIIIRVLLCTQRRQYLQMCINDAMKKQIINQKILVYIESHTLTSNSTEAWILLNFVAGKVKCKEPDSLISSFIKSMNDQSWNAGQNLHIILEVLLKCIKDFSHSALNMAFSCIVKLVKDGVLPPSIIGKSLDLCLTISGQSENKRVDGASIDRSHLKWVEDIHSTCETYLLENLNNFYSHQSRFISYLFSYAECNLELLIKPKETIIKFIHNTMRELLSIEETEYDSEDIILINQMILLSVRFSLRDSSVAATSCYLYGVILKKNDRPPIVNTILVALSDLCKRHTQVVETIMGSILIKLKSPYMENRMATFDNLSSLILQDVLKLRGNLLLSLMTIMLDENDELSNKATEFFLTYLDKKNSGLFQTCLLECPFVYNDYMHFDGFESFSGIEIQSSLKGEENRRSRQLLYNAFMLKIDEINLLMYFGHLKLIYGKMLKDESIKSEEGFATITDMLYILKRICNSVSEKKDNKNSEINDTDDVELTPNAESSKTQNCDAPKRGRRKDAPTMNEAIALVEKAISIIPKMSDLLLKWDESFEKYIDDLAFALCKKFDNLTEFAKPTSFWSKYQNTFKEKSSGKKRKSDVNDLTDDENEMLSLPKKDCNKNSDLPTKILFHPFS